MDTSLTGPNPFKKFFAILSALLITLALLAGCASAPYVQPFDNKDYDLAIAKAKEVLNEKPQDSRAWYYLGRSYLEKGQYAEAEKALHKALRNPDYYWKEDMLRQLARVYVKTGDYDRALEEYDRLLKDYPNSAIDWIERGYVYIYLAKYKESLKSFEKAVEVENKYWSQASRYTRKYEYKKHYQRMSDASRGKAFAYLGQQDKEKALKMIEEAKRIDSEHDTKEDFALIYYALADEGGLQDHLTVTGSQITKEEMDNNPIIAPFVNRRNAKRKAVSEIEKIEKRNELRRAFRMYMELLTEDNLDYDVLSRVIRLARKLDPPPATPERARKHAIFAEAAVKRATDERGYDTAIEEYKRAINLAPWWAELYINTALLMESRKLYFDAGELLKLYLVASPSAADAEQVSTKIYQLEYEQQLKRKIRRTWHTTWITTEPVKVGVYEEMRDSSPRHYSYELPDDTFNCKVKFAIIDVTQPDEVEIEEASWCTSVPHAKWEGEVSATSLKAKMPTPIVTTTKYGTLTLTLRQFEILREKNNYTANFSYIVENKNDYAYRKFTFDYNGPISRKE